MRGLADLATAELEAEARETDAPVELGDVKAVRLMSVHAAKGLEFPVVCIADLGRQRPADGDEDLLVAEGEVGLRLVGLDGTSEPALAYERLRDRARARAAARGGARDVRRARRAPRSGSSSAAACRSPTGRRRAPRRRRWPGSGRRCSAATCARCPTSDEPIADVAWGDGARVRCAVNTPQTVGRVLREDALAPAGARLPVAPPPRAAPARARAGRRAARAAHAVVLAPGGLAGSAAIATTCSASSACPTSRSRRDEAQAEGRRRAAVAGLDPRTRGSLVHALLEHADADLATLAASWGLELTEEEHADVLRLPAAFARLAAARGASSARAASTASTRFTVALGDTLLTGIVDVLAHERGGQLVVDYKTDALDPGDRPRRATSPQHYGVQRRVYALAALRGGAPRVEVAYAFLERPGEPVAERFEAADADRARGASCARSPPGCWPASIPSRRCRTASCA